MADFCSFDFSVSVLVGNAAAAKVMPISAIMGPAVAPAMAPAMAPGSSVTPADFPFGKPLTFADISMATIAACPAIESFYSQPDFSTFLTVGDLASNNTITVPSGIVVALAPTNEAFQAVLDSGLATAAMASNATLVGDLLAYNSAVAPNAIATTATTLGMPSNIEFMVNGSPATPAEVAAAAPGTAMVMDTNTGITANVTSSVACPGSSDVGFYAFGTDALLIPASLLPSMAPAPAPEVMPDIVPAVAPAASAPAPAPASSATMAASGAAVALALLSALF